MANSKPIAIIGLGVLTGPQFGRSARMVAAEAASLALADAQMSPSMVDGAIKVDHFAGGGDLPDYADSFSRMLAMPTNCYLPSARGGVAMALVLASALLDRGMANYVCISDAQLTRSRAEAAKAKGFRGRPLQEREGYWGRPVGDLRAASHHSWMAARHMYEYGTTSAQLGAIAVQERAWACMNPEAQMFGKPITVDDHQSSPMVVNPYHLLDISQISDGGLSLIVTTADRARDSARPPVMVLGQGVNEIASEMWWEKKNYTHMAVAGARDMAFAEAGIALGDIDAAMLYDCFTAEVLFQLEDYGWCEKGEGGAFVETGAIGPGGAIPVNTGGGLLSSYHLADATGFIEGIRQLRGEAGERQLAGPDTVLVTTHGNEHLSPGMCSIHIATVLGAPR